MCSTSLLPISPSHSFSLHIFSFNSSFNWMWCVQACMRACMSAYVGRFMWLLYKLFYMMHQHQFNGKILCEYAFRFDFIFIFYWPCWLFSPWPSPRPFCHNASPLASHITVDVFQICNYLFTSFLVRLLFFFRWCKWVRATQKTTSTNTLTVIHKHTINCPNVPMPITIKLPKWKL